MRRSQAFIRHRLLIGIAILFLAGAVSTTVFSANITSQVVVGNAAPTVSSVAIGSSTITLTANATTNVNVTAIVADNNGCSDLSGGTTTILFYRNSFTSSTCQSGGTTSLDCYKATAFTATSSCVGNGTSINVTTTFAVQYFARATDASSSFPSVGWRASVLFTDPTGATSTNDSSTSTVSTLNAINVTTSSINFGSLTPNTNTGSTNQTATTTNAGNSSTTLQLSALQTLTSGSNTIATSSQVYSTSSFTYAGTSTALTGSAVTVSGFTLTAPTTTTNVSQATFWGLSVPNGTATGTYTGTNIFAALFVP